MTSRFVGAVVAACGLIACQDSGHPEGRAMLPQLEGEAVVTVDGHPITAAEVEEFAATADDASLEQLVEREVAARRAAEDDVDVEFARKRAMVDAFLTDEIEGNVTTEDVPDDMLEPFREDATSDLVSPGGFEAVAVRVFATELGRDPTPQRREELLALVSATGERIYEALPERDALDAVNSLDLSWVDPAVTVRVLQLRILDSGTKVTAPIEGWSRAPRLSAAFASLPDGALSPYFVTGDSPVFAVRKARIEPRTASAEEIEAEAVKRALVELRARRTQELIDELRERSVVVTHMEAFEEEP